MKKVLLITEFINPPYDEGIKKIAFKIFSDLDCNYNTKVICRHGFKNDNIHIVKSNKLFFSLKVNRIISDFSPDLLIYLPFQSSTFASYIRLKVLSTMNTSANTILFALQPKNIKKWQKYFLMFLKPALALTPSLTLSKMWSALKISHHIVPLSTDISIFNNVDKNKKLALRAKYGLDEHKFIVSHMGHLNYRRNLEALIPLQRSDIQVIVVTSTSSPKSTTFSVDIKEKLCKNGVIVFDHFIENIEEIYQLSDAYVFPVIDENASIGMPLSILEARACGIPVITTDYGSVKFFFGDDYGGIKYSTANLFLENCHFFKIKDQLFLNSKVLNISSKFDNLIKSNLS